MANPVSAKPLEAISLKRSKIADADKVRYRVYRAEGDFVAVIAESALMAMKVSGIMNPHRIVRDLPNEMVAIEAQRMAAADESTPRVILPVEQQRPEGSFRSTDMGDRIAPSEGDFVPMQVKDFQKKRQIPWARILTPEMVEQAQSAARPAPVPVAPPAAPPQETLEAPVVDVVEPLAEIQPEPVVAAPVSLPEAAPIADTGVLSEDEVQQLLNG